ncbi:MAG: phosphodiester glycosidase family protein [Clostridia bacterium]
MNQIMGKQKDEEINLKTEKKEKAPKKKSKKNKKSKGIIKKILITIAVLAIIGGSTLGILLYGPYNGFRDWLITSAMTTMTHQWIAYLFYDEDTINAVMASNRVDEVQEDTDTNAIVVGVSEEPEKTYENEYEKAILEKNNPRDTYKIIEIEGKGYSGYLAAIYDPSKIHTLVTSKIGTSGQYLTTMAKNNKAVVAINGGGFDDPNYSSNAANPLGITYSKGKLLTSYYYAGAGGIIGFDTNNKLVLSSKCTEQSAKSLKIRDAVTCGPFLIVNGKKSGVVGNGGWGTAPRTAIGQRKDGIVLFLVVDGRTVKRPGADMDDLIEIMQNYGAYNAANLDGGTSTAMTVNYELINDPVDSSGAHKTRFVSTGFGLIE